MVPLINEVLASNKNRLDQIKRQIEDRVIQFKPKKQYTYDNDFEQEVAVADASSDDDNDDKLSSFSDAWNTFDDINSELVTASDDED